MLYRCSQHSKARTSPVNLIKLHQCYIAENNSELVFCKEKVLQVKELKTENAHVSEQVYAASNYLAYCFQAISEWA